MTIKLFLALIVLFSTSLYADTIPQNSDSVVIEKPQYIEDDGEIPGNIERSERLSIKSSEFLDVNHDRKIAPYYSLIIPGAGHYKLGKKNAAKTFMAADGILWAGFAFSMFHKSRMTDNIR
ncbi:MAG: hypothetical protein JNL74_24590, partial [Fibrobacteres bacterium]|nr:hypothetical protein [Fibrobacterota bacterium]